MSHHSSEKPTVKGMITAHSGCDHTADNSLDFIRYALQLDVDAFEVDVCQNSEGNLILDHDGGRPDAPMLSEAFALLKNHPEKKINCDLKQPGLEAAVFALAQAFGVENQLIYTGDVNASLFQKDSVVFPSVTWYANLECFAPECRTWPADEALQRLEAVLETMLAYETAGLNWYFAVAELVWQKAREKGIGLSVWTVNEAAQQQVWLERGAENITTRQAAQLLSLRRSV